MISKPEIVGLVKFIVTAFGLKGIAVCRVEDAEEAVAPIL
jgi:hypothetical protein